METIPNQDNNTLKNQNEIHFPMNEEVSQIRNLKVLIAEDDEGSAMLIAMAIRGFSKEILRAGNGLEAVEACRNHPDIDLVLMDIKMPEMDGYEATRQIRQFNKAVIIIAQTAYALSGDREKTIETGCNDYISKPIKKPQFMELMEKYFKS
jgi:CheY-like chemotaxis protein